MFVLGYKSEKNLTSYNNCILRISIQFRESMTDLFEDLDKFTKKLDEGKEPQNEAKP